MAVMNCRGSLKGAALAAESDLRKVEASNKRKQPGLFDTALLILARSLKYKRQGEPVCSQKQESLRL